MSAGAAAGDEAVDVVAQAHELGGGAVACVGDEYQGVGGQACLHHTFPKGVGDGHVGVERGAEPRRKATFPDFRHSPKASEVTLGLLS